MVEPHGPLQEATNLIPEVHLMAKLSPIWRQRFEQAILLIQDLDSELSWQEIAQQCAISSYHFLRMFRLVFNETPGHYKARIRLQMAVTILIDQMNLSMTEVAHQSGYSSSQSFAKALKRELGYSAKQLRKLAQDYDQLQPIITQLGHPAGNLKERSKENLERDIAQKIPFKVIECPARHFQLKSLSPPGIFTSARLWKSFKLNKQQSMINLMSIEELDEPIQSQTLLIGYEVNDASLANHTCKASLYLHCRVIVDSEISYLSVWDAFLNYSMSHDIEFVEDSFVIEEIHNPNELLTAASDISFYIGLKVIKNI